MNRKADEMTRMEKIEAMDMAEEQARFEAKGLNVTDDGRFQCKVCMKQLMPIAFPMHPARRGHPEGPMHLQLTCRSCKGKKQMMTGRKNKKVLLDAVRRAGENGNGQAEIPVGDSPGKSARDRLELVLCLRDKGWTSAEVFEVSAHMEYMEKSMRGES